MRVKLKIEWRTDCKRRYDKKNTSKEFAQIFNAFKIETKKQVERNQMNGRRKRNKTMQKTANGQCASAICGSIAKWKKRPKLCIFSIPFRLVCILLFCNANALFTQQSQEDRKPNAWIACRCNFFHLFLCVCFAQVSIKLT